MQQTPSPVTGYDNIYHATMEQSRLSTLEAHLLPNQGLRELLANVLLQADELIAPGLPHALVHLRTNI